MACNLPADIKWFKQVFKNIRKKYGHLDAVINCAVTNPSVSHFILIPSNIVSQAYKTNVFGLMTICREAVKIMMRKKFGRIINLGSMAAKHEIVGDSIYASSKSAIHTFSRVLAKEVYSNGITCNVVAPAAIRTDLSVDMDQVVLNEALGRNAIKDYGEMEDVSNLTDWLLKDESNAITGQIIYLGGA